MAALYYAPYLPRGGNDRLDWALNFAQNITSYAARFGLTPAETTDIAVSVAALNYARTTLVNYTRSFSKGVTAFADELDTDPTPNPMPFPVFSPPAAPTAAQSGIFKRIDAIVETKILPVATNAEKTALRLFPIDTPSTVTPEITDLEALMRGQVSLTFRRGGSKQIFIYSRRGSEAALTLLDKVADPHFLDERPNLVAGVGEARDYAIEWSLDGTHGNGVMSPIRTIATLG